MQAAGFPQVFNLCAGRHVFPGSPWPAGKVASIRKAGSRAGAGDPRASKRVDERTGRRAGRRVGGGRADGRAGEGWPERVDGRRGRQPGSRAGRDGGGWAKKVENGIKCHASGSNPCGFDPKR